ncbi:MAG: hypothetical protein Fur0022_33850 [Anaerolineales bacterium]
MLAQDQILQPFHTSDGNLPLLLDFARQMVIHLVPDFPITDLVDQKEETEPYDFDRKTIRYGSPVRGLEAVHSKGYEPKYGGQAVDEVWVTVYGLPDGMGLKIGCVRAWNNPRYLKLSVTGPDAGVSTVLNLFNAHFGGKIRLSDSQLQNALLSLNRALRQGAWASAKLWADDILKHRPKESQALFALGVVHAVQKEYDRAEFYLASTLEISPTHYDACYNLALVHLEMNQPQKAAELLRRSLTLEPENHPVYYQLGIALERAGARQEALQAYRAAARTSPNPGGHWGYSGKDFTQQAEQALARLEKQKVS